MILVLKRADFSRNNIGQIQIGDITDSNAISIRDQYYPNMSDLVFKHFNRFIVNIKSLYNSWDDIKALCLPIISGNVNEAKINVVTGNTIFEENSEYNFHDQTKQLYLPHYARYNFNLSNTGLSSDDFTFALSRQEGNVSDHEYDYEVFMVAEEEIFKFDTLSLAFPSPYICGGIGGAESGGTSNVLFSKPCVVSLLNKERNICMTSSKGTLYNSTRVYSDDTKNIEFKNGLNSVPGSRYKGYQVILISKGLTGEKCKLLKRYMDEFVNALMV